ncbi:MAG TPA: glycosyltransferase [Methylocella sp.]|nr:glycosyltransferase [Methylocella sp.]
MKAHLPEIILCPRELEFIREERPGRYYLGCNIDLQRQEADFPWNLLGSRRLIYCSLGTVSWFDKATYQRFFQVILDVAATKSTFQWVISLYDVVNPEDFANVPSNVLLVKRAPQLALLRRCVIAIVHGGGNTTKECAYFGVPMVVFPLGLDQPGNAARVVYHGLGVRGDFSSVTADQMSALVDRVDRDSFFQMQARLMGERLRAADIGRSAVDFVEKLLSTPKVEKLLSARG